MQNVLSPSIPTAELLATQQVIPRSTTAGIQNIFSTAIKFTRTNIHKQ
jgi:hypothetical protein